jgi:hypothetical protein
MVNWGTGGRNRSSPVVVYHLVIYVKELGKFTKNLRMDGLGPIFQVGTFCRSAFIHGVPVLGPVSVRVQ